MSTDPRGRLVTLDDTRLVFVGEDPAYPGIKFVGFRNDKGNDLYLSLNTDAADALGRLLTTPQSDEDRDAFPYRPEWEVVAK